MGDVVAWVTAHSVLVSGAAVAVLDFAFALVPSWESNGIVHWLYLQAKALGGSKAP